MHKKDIFLLNKLKKFFGVGNIVISKTRDHATFVVSSKTDIKDNILPLPFGLDKYPLLTKKRWDYIFFKSIIDIMIKGDHLNIEGLGKILSFKASLNLGLTENLKESFPFIKPLSDLNSLCSTLDLNVNLKDKNWLVGFSEGDGSFNVGLTKTKLYRSGYQVSLRFSITQHNRDIYLMEIIAKYFNCGKVIVSATQRKKSGCRI